MTTNNCTTILYAQNELNLLDINKVPLQNKKLPIQK